MFTTDLSLFSSRLFDVFALIEAKNCRLPALLNDVFNTNVTLHSRILLEEPHLGVCKHYGVGRLARVANLGTIEGWQIISIWVVCLIPGRSEEAC